MALSDSSLLTIPKSGPSSRTLSARPISQYQSSLLFLFWTVSLFSNLCVPFTPIILHLGLLLNFKPPLPVHLLGKFLPVLQWSSASSSVRALDSFLLMWVFLPWRSYAPSLIFHNSSHPVVLGSLICISTLPCVHCEDGPCTWHVWAPAPSMAPGIRWTCNRKACICRNNRKVKWLEHSFGFISFTFTTVDSWFHISILLFSVISSRLECLGIVYMYKRHASALSAGRVHALFPILYMACHSPEFKVVRPRLVFESKERQYLVKLKMKTQCFLHLFR